MNAVLRFLPDRFTSALVAVVLLATFAPAHGMFAALWGNATAVAIAERR